MAAPDRHYRSVHFAIIHWNEARTGSQGDEELLSLRHALMEFNFQPYNITIQRPNPQGSLQDGLKNFYKTLARKQRPRLAILIYSGHAGGTPGASGGLTWFSDTGVPIDWTHVQDNLVQEQQVDTLLVLDCCDAAAAFPPLETNTGTSYELDIFAAVGPDDTTYYGQYTFTKVLTKTLRDLQGNGFTLTQLWLRLQAEGGTRLQNREYYRKEQVLGHRYQGRSNHQANRKATQIETENGYSHEPYQRCLVPSGEGPRLPETQKILRRL